MKLQPWQKVQDDVLSMMRYFLSVLRLLWECFFLDGLYIISDTHVHRPGPELTQTPKGKSHHSSTKART